MQVGLLFILGNSHFLYSTVSDRTSTDLKRGGLKSSWRDLCSIITLICEHTWHFVGLDSVLAGTKPSAGSLLDFFSCH